MEGATKRRTGHVLQQEGERSDYGLTEPGLGTYCCQERVHLEGARAWVPAQRVSRDEFMRVMGESTAAVIHELKSPLQAIRAHLQLLERSIRRDGLADYGERFPLLYQEIDRMSGLLAEYLELTTAGHKPHRLLSLCRLSAEVVLLMRSLCIHHGVELEEAYQADLPMVFADEQQIKQIIINLLVNAIGACRPGGHIWLRVYQEDAYLVLAVCDDGVGISAENLGKIFVPHFTTKKNGSGLGLAICRQFAAYNDGTLTVESKLGEGASFYLRLPCEAVHCS